MVGSAASQGATRPSYFGPESQKFISNGLAAWAAGPNANRPSMTPSAATAGFFRDEKRSRMSNPPNGILREFGADGDAKPRQRQVQGGNTSPQLRGKAQGKQT